MNLRLTNASNNDGNALGVRLQPPASPRVVYQGAPVVFRRYLAAGDGRLHEQLQAQLGEDYAQALIDGDPEVDFETVGRTVEDTQTVYLSSSGDLLYAAPLFQEIIYNPDGTERERRDPVETAGNVDTAEAPLRWGRKLKQSEAVRRFVFGRTLQVRHSNGVEYEWLYGMAKTLADERVLVLLGAGPKGNEPLIFQANGVPWRGFLEGRVHGKAYMLLLHLSKMELKRPEAT